MIDYYKVGIDVGSTTIKVIILDKNDNIIYSDYKRHNSDIKITFIRVFNKIRNILHGKKIKVKVAGSGGMLISDFFDIGFIQEVIASTKTIRKLIPETDVAIELGGEDAKIIYFGHTIDQRMNGACAGGTGAFIDQMAVLLNTDAQGLNALAKDYQTIYPIASRCGVFAKTDVQPLLNEGVDKEDIAASIFQAVVNQTIGGLSAGKPIKGKVAFLGGPLTYLSELRNRFYETLDLGEEDIIFPDKSRYFVAIGAAIAAEEEEVLDAVKIYNKFNEFKNSMRNNNKTLRPLFKNQEEYKAFKNRHAQNKVKRKKISDIKGNVFLGIDAGSTTSKLVLIDEDLNLVHSFYTNNNGDPLKAVKKELMRLYNILPTDVNIAYSAITGYGEHLIKEALKIDVGEIETICHYRAAKEFKKDVDFILDIGGQDMKSLKINNGVVESIMLNEACSSGCGSFIETFAKSLNMDVKDFSKEALFSDNPVDLGTRCTVFMNSKVKQSQKEGATIGDISAGISYSVIKNALFKVIRLKETSDLGENIVVQGGTFYNEAVLRAIELIIDKEVIRPDISGIMGAYGSAIIAKERYLDATETSLLSSEALEFFKIERSNRRCGLCGNNCLLTINEFNNDRKFISGNRCEKGAGNIDNKNEIPNLYNYKYNRLFDYKPIPQEASTHGLIGIPRVLNMYDNYPFWHTLLSTLGYRVVLSGRSSQKLFELGMDSIPSESVCYPAKLVHGHIEDLINKGINKIFYPSIPYNIKEDDQADNKFNCPVVTSYPETIKANMESIKENNIEYINNFFPLHDEQQMIKKCYEVFEAKGHNKSQIKTAVKNAYEELNHYYKDLQTKGEEVLEYIEKNNMNGIVLAGRPYHVDPEINHGIAKMIENYEIPVLTEDSIAHLARVDRPLNVVDQWVYHTRLYNAAKFVAKRSDIEFVQLNSFGCGLDAVTTDQVKDILESHDKIFTLIKIDEINNLGAARIRIRSLMAIMDNQNITLDVDHTIEKTEFTSDMKEEYTILAPQMAPMHFKFLQSGFHSEGYNVEILPEVTDKTIDEGLKYVNNDACYPSLLVVGQIMQALKSGKYDLDKTAILISQTGGGCRATNYISFIRRALKDANIHNIPVISLNAGGLEKNEGFKLSLSLVKKLTMGLIYGDLLSKVVLKLRPYEKVPGSVNELYEHWEKICSASLKEGKFRDFKKNIYNIVEAFDAIEILAIEKPKVGIVGEILVKYHPGANNDIVGFLEAEGAEAVVPDLTGFMLYSAYNHVIKRDLLHGSWLSSIMGKMAIKYIEFYRKDMNKALEESNRFEPSRDIETLAEGASNILSLGHQTGEGWFLTAEMIELLEDDVPNIACLQPFACLPNHITGKAMIKQLKEKFPYANITAIDYDPGASEVNQINRLKLMLSTAFNENDTKKYQDEEDIV